MTWKRIVAVGAVAALGGGVGCALPTGSYARPAAPVPAGTHIVGGGLMVPFGAAGAVTESAVGDQSFGAFGDGSFFVPGFSYDYAAGDSQYWGADFAIFTDSLAGQDVLKGFTIIKINPRVEWPIGDGASRNLSWGVDTNILIWTGETGDGGNDTLLVATPTVGIRYYLNTGFGGLVLTQNVGTAFVTLTAPGSISYDIPIGPIHILPEFRWDPTFFFSGLQDIPSGVAVFFSAGASVLIEL